MSQVPPAEISRWLAGLARNPDVCLHQLDFPHARALLVGLDEAGYRAASFLDERALGADTTGVWLPLDAVAAQLDALAPRPLNAIFHVGHCGSTLLARLLGELAGVFALREPLPWLALAMHRRELDRPGAPLAAAAWDAWFERTLRTLGRSYRASDVALVKSTSVGANLAPLLLDRRPEAHVVLLTTSFETHLATMLRAPETRESARHYAPAWHADLVALGGRPLAPPADDAEACALAWVAPTLWFERLRLTHRARVLRIVFEDLLADPARWLGEAARHLGLAPAPEELERVIRSPLMHRSAKDPGSAYGVGERTRELAMSRHRHAAEIAAALRWAERFGVTGERPRTMED